MLTIYRASAGAGKTFALTLEYFKIVFSNPQEYKNVLAVTFTNKATEEMKGRILAELNKLASGKVSAYQDALCYYLQIDAVHLQERAKYIQTLLLHDYSNLSVNTIDAFFQRVVKSFTRELGIFAGYNIELDNKGVLSKAVDMLLNRLNDQADLRKWIDELIRENIQEGKSWNVRQSIEKQGNELFKETFKMLPSSMITKLQDKAYLKEYRQIVQEYIKVFQASAQEVCGDAIALIAGQGLTPFDFSYGVGGVAGVFYKILDGKIEPLGSRVRKVYETGKGWAAAKSPVRSQIECIENELNKCLSDLIAFYDEQLEAYLTAQLINRQLQLLGILSDLTIDIRNYCQEQDVMLLSDTTHLINALIEGNNVSFVYEKMGVRYKHIMIDEFQDTSLLQWNNFRPLLENTSSQAGTTMLVGDVKQSIYRFRNSDWGLLATQAEHEFEETGVKNIYLENNWRSCPEIVEFNNKVFKYAALLLNEKYSADCPETTEWKDMITRVYDDLLQHPQQKVHGFVEVKVFEKEDDIETRLLSYYVEQIHAIQKRGAQLRQIAFLVRKADEGRQIADFLLTYNNEHPDEAINFISNDSLFVNSSLYVRFIIAILTYIMNPEDAVNRAMIYAYYHNYIKHDMVISNSLYDQTEVNEQNFFKVHIDEEMAKFNTLSIFEIVERIIALFQLNEKKEEIPYLLSFQDAVFGYEKNHTNTLLAFMNWWDDQQSKLLLSTSQQVDAVTILTIHKSKGLEYDYVLIPYCNWDIDNTKHAEQIWCSTNNSSFKGLEYIPAVYNKSLLNTQLKESYNVEHLRTFVDSLNVLYVALTRAKYELYVGLVQPEKEYKSIDDVNKLMLTVLDEIRTTVPLDESIVFDEEGTLRYGTPVSNTKEKSKWEIESINEYPVLASSDELSIRYKYKDYEELSEAIHTALDEGKVMHGLFKTVKNSADVEEAVRQGVTDGIIGIAEELTYIEKMHNYMNNPEVDNWFSGEWSLINERDIIMPNGERLRPDRVMVSRDGQVIVLDYKFGMKEANSYKSQVKRYCKVLKESGYNKVSGVIWYPRLQKKIVV